MIRSLNEEIHIAIAHPFPSRYINIGILFHTERRVSIDVGLSIVYSKLWIQPVPTL
jgi:hypothetical protein